MGMQLQPHGQEDETSPGPLLLPTPQLVLSLPAGSEQPMGDAAVGATFDEPEVACAAAAAAAATHHSSSSGLGAQRSRKRQVMHVCTLWAGSTLLSPEDFRSVHVARFLSPLLYHAI
jgi:hypothetical protein